VSFLTGVCPRRISPAHCAALGRAMAEMHLAGASFVPVRPNDLSVEGWRRLCKATETRADEVAPGLAAEIAREFDQLAAAWPSGLPAGVIHADLFPDNVFFLDAKVSGVIDFYFACNDFLAYDLAVCLNAWCFEPDLSFNATKARLMCASYRALRPIGADELAAMPILARGAALRFLLTRLYDWLNHPEGAFVRPKDPKEYLARLRFHRGVAGPGAYGLT
jgi:homoserine kinase type II